MDFYRIIRRNVRWLLRLTALFRAKPNYENKISQLAAKGRMATDKLDRGINMSIKSDYRANVNPIILTERHLLGHKFESFVGRIILLAFRLIFSLGFIFITASVANAASFNCAKASHTVEKLICKNPKILGQDWNMAFIYKYALLYGKDSRHLKSTQREWLKHRNQCKNEECLTENYQARTEALITMIDGSIRPSPTPDDLKGLWYSTDRAAQAVYGTILITDRHVIWGARELFQQDENLEGFCKTIFSIEKEAMGISFENEYGHTLVLDENSQFKTYKIKLTDPCGLKLKYLRFILNFRSPYAKVVEYHQDGSWAGSAIFQKHE
jgi:uncharacterized protein YecT (DUF1311 family)